MGRGVAMGVPLWVLLVYGFALLRMVPIAAFALATIFAFAVVEFLERFVMTTRRRRRVATAIGLVACTMWVVVPYVLAAIDGASRRR